MGNRYGCGVDGCVEKDKEWVCLDRAKPQNRKKKKKKKKAQPSLRYEDEMVQIKRLLCSRLAIRWEFLE